MVYSQPPCVPGDGQVGGGGAQALFSPQGQMLVISHGVLVPLLEQWFPASTSTAFHTSHRSSGAPSFPLEAGRAES